MSDYNELRRNQVGSDPLDEPQVRGPPGAKLGDLGLGGGGPMYALEFRNSKNF